VNLIDTDQVANRCEKKRKSGSSSINDIHSYEFNTVCPLASTASPLIPPYFGSPWVLEYSLWMYQSTYSGGAEQSFVNFAPGMVWFLVPSLRDVVLGFTFESFERWHKHCSTLAANNKTYNENNRCSFIAFAPQQNGEIHLEVISETLIADIFGIF
jgi:hypothetical protein